jgi:hypothetical protein
VRGKPAKVDVAELASAVAVLAGLTDTFTAGEVEVAKYVDVA